MDALAANLRRLRKQAKLTQADLAEQSGLPRATLAAMEQNGANPGIQSVMVVAKALHVSLDELLVQPPEHRHYLVTPVQIHYVTMQPGCHTIGRPHPIGAQEFYHCLSGTSVIHIEDEIVTVPAGHLVQFPGHRRHIYANPDKNVVTTAMSVVVFRMG